MIAALSRQEIAVVEAHATHFQPIAYGIAGRRGPDQAVGRLYATAKRHWYMRVWYAILKRRSGFGSSGS